MVAHSTKMFAAAVALWLAVGADTATAGDLEWAIGGSSKEGSQIKIILNDEPVQGTAQIQIPKGKNPTIDLELSFEAKGYWEISGEGTYDTGTDDLRVKIKMKFSW